MAEGADRSLADGEFDPRCLHHRHALVEGIEQDRREVGDNAENCMTAARRSDMLAAVGFSDVFKNPSIERGLVPCRVVSVRAEEPASNDQPHKGALVMRRIKLLGLALVAVFASAAALSTSAFALTLPENLPVSATERTWTGGSEGKPELLGGGLPEAVVCEKAPATGTEEAGKPLGLFHIDFEGCKTKTTKVACTGLSEASEVILALGTWHLVFDKKTPELLTAVLFLVEHVHFLCGIVLILVLGSVLCLHLKPTESNVTHSFHCIVEIMANGEELQVDKTYFNNAGTEVSAGLECSVSEAPEKPCFELALGQATYGVKIFADI